MKKLTTLLLIILPNLMLAQMTTINPDTVCYQTGGSIYEVQNTVGLTYIWNTTTSGIITGGQGTNQITVDWSTSNPGLIVGGVQVQASNNIGCLSPVVTLDVFIYDVNPTLTLLPNMCEGGSCVPLNGIPAGGVWSGNGVILNEFCPINSGQFNLTYTYSNAGCTFVSVMLVDVLPQPMLLPIEHN